VTVKATIEVGTFYAVDLRHPTRGRRSASRRTAASLQFRGTWRSGSQVITAPANCAEPEKATVQAFS
jgi:hypothetical protein